MGTKRLLAVLISPILYFSPLTMLNQAFSAEDAITGASIVSYQPDYFVKFSPVTLLDMLQRVPGVPEILNKNRRKRNQRGFGSGGDQILIDGKRLSGKSNNINDVLARISADQIAKIDLIRGAASGLDVQSQGLVINISLKEGVSKSSTFWKILGEYTFSKSLIPQFLISHNGSIANLEYSFSAERQNDNGYRPRAEVFYDGDDIQTGTRDIDHMFKFRGVKLTTNLSYHFDDGAEFRLNGLYDPKQFLTHELRKEQGNTPQSVVWDSDKENKKWEIGGDYSRNLNSLGHFKTLFVINNNIEDTKIDRLNDFSDPDYIYAKESTNATRSEKIFRSSITPKITKSQTIEIGGEMAINTFNKLFNSFGRDNSMDMLLLETADDVKIKENRYEIFVIHSFNISAKTVLQSSVTTEFSKIVADNRFVDGSSNRRDTSFTYIKPRLNLRYDYSAKDQLRATIEKKVSQLNFASFVTSYDAQNDQVNYGNTKLRPTQIWEFSLAYDHRLANDNGSLEGKIYYNYRKDHQTRIDFTNYQDFNSNSIDVEGFFNLPPTAALRELINFTSTQGNIDNAYIYGVDLKSNLRLGFFGVPQAVLSLGYRFEKRKSIDQFTQLLRNFSRHSDHVYNVNFRHDVTKWSFSYGLDVSIRSDWANYDMKFYNPTSPSAGIKAFAEYNLANGIKMRVDLLEITGSAGHSTSLRYTDHIRFDEKYKREEIQNDRPRAIQVSLQGTF